MRNPALGLAATLLLLACGGGGGGGGPDITIDAPPVAALDGSVSVTGVVNTTGVLVPPGGIAVGDDVVDVAIRGFFAFDISGLPAGARVQAATLELRVIGSAGSPTPSLGNVLIDHVAIGPALDAGDYSSAALDAGFATVTSSSLPGTYILDVRSQVGADGIAGRTTSAFRVRFTSPTNNNTTVDVVLFQDAEDADGSGLLPSLTIAYKM